MLKFLTSILAITLCLNVFSQNSRKQTLVLKDGSSISGIILSDTTDVIKIKITNPQTITFNKSEVLRIEPAAEIKSNPQGYSIHFTTSVLVGNSDWGGVYDLSFQLSNSFHLSYGVRLGVGTGIEHLEVPIIPLFVDINYHPLNSRVSPFVYLKSGYGFALLPSYDNYLGGYYNSSVVDTKGGFTFNSGIGMSLFAWQNTAVTMGVGYRYQKVTLFTSDFWWQGAAVREFVTHFNRFEIQLGFLFR